MRSRCDSRGGTFAQTQRQRLSPPVQRARRTRHFLRPARATVPQTASWHRRKCSRSGLFVSRSGSALQNAPQCYSVRASVYRRRRSVPPEHRRRGGILGGATALGDLTASAARVAQASTRSPSDATSTMPGALRTGGRRSGTGWCGLSRWVVSTTRARLAGDGFSPPSTYSTRLFRNQPVHPRTAVQPVPFRVRATHPSRLIAPGASSLALPSCARGLEAVCRLSAPAGARAFTLLFAPVRLTGTHAFQPSTTRITSVALSARTSNSQEI